MSDNDDYQITLADDIFWAGIFWLCGTLILFAPIYFEIIGYQLVFNIMGSIFLALGLIWIIFSIGDHLKNENIGDFGVTLFFIIPAIFLHLNLNSIPEAFQYIGKIIVYILMFIGVVFVFTGISNFFYYKNENKISTEKKSEEKRIFGDKLSVNTTMSLIVAILTFITVLLKFF